MSDKMFLNPSNSIDGVNAADMVDATLTAIVAAVSGARIYLKTMTVSNLGASNVRVDILCNGVVRWSVPAAANGGGGVIPFDGIGLRGVRGQGWSAQCSGAGGAVRVSLYGYVSKEPA